MAESVTDAVTRYRGVRAAAVLSLGGTALIAGVDVLAVVVADRWREDQAVGNVVFWALVGLGVVLLAGLLRAVAQVVRQPVVLRLDETGYRVSRQSGSTGVRQARWTEVERVRRDHHDGRECVVIQLRSGDTTQIPVRSVAVSRPDLLAELDDRLNRAHGQRRLT